MFRLYPNPTAPSLPSCVPDPMTVRCSKGEHARQCGTALFFHPQPTHPSLFFFFWTHRCDQNKEAKAKLLLTYCCNNRLKVEAKRIGVRDHDLCRKVDRERSVTIIKLELGNALHAKIVDRGQLEHCDDHNGQDNDDEEEDQTEAAGKATTGRADAREARQVL